MKKSDENVELVLIRHGQTRGNAEKRYIGRTDEPLSEIGRKELEARKARGDYPEAGSLYLSPLRRCIQTADILYSGRKFTVIDEFREMEFGLFEGKNYTELSGDPEYQSWIDSGGLMAFPGGESRAEFIGRSLRGFSGVMKLEEKKFEDTNKAMSDRQVFCEKWNEENSTYAPLRRITLIVHGGTIMALLSVLCGGDYWKYQVPNGGGFRVRLQSTAEKGDRRRSFRWKGEIPARI